MHEAIILESIIRTVPQWYLCQRGPNEHVLTVNDASVKFCSHRPLTKNLLSLLDHARERLPVWEQQIPRIPTPSSMAKIGGDLALKWLELEDPTVDWNKWVAYAELRFL